MSTYAGDALAIDRSWIAANGGTFTTPGNWSGGVVPSSADQAIFDLSDPGYIVNFAGNALTDRLTVRSDVVTLNLNGFTYSLNSSIAVSPSSTETGSLRLNDGTLVTSSSLTVSSTGTLLLGSPSTLRTNSASILGTVAFVSTQADWLNSATMTVGSSAGARIVADFSGDLATGTLIVGQTNTSGSVELDDGSHLDAGSVTIASGGAGTLELFNGGDAVLTGRLSIAAFGSGTIPTETTRGVVLVDGVGSSIAAAELHVGGGQGAGSLTVINGGTISTSGVANIGLGGGAGTVAVGGSGSRWDAGSINVGSSGAALLDVSAGASVIATGALNVATFGTVNVTDATLSAGAFGAVNGRLNFNSGTLAVTGASGLSIGGATTPLGPSIQLNGNQDLKVTTTLTLQSAGQLALDGGRITAGTFTNNGELLFLSPTSRVTGNVNNFGIIRGSGAIVGGVVRNKAGGQISVAAGEHLRVAGVVVNEQSGMIDIAAGGEFDGGNLTNSGRIFIDDGLLRASSIDVGTTSLIQGRGSIITAGPFVNNGTVSLSGGFSDVVSASPYNTQFTGKTIVSGGATASFFLPVNNLAGSEFRVSTNSTAVFFNPVSGLGAFTGTGTIIFESTTAPGVIDRGGTTVVESGGALDAQHVRENALVVRGPVTISPNGTATGTSRVSRLEIDGDRLDLSDNDLVIDYAGPSPIAEVRQHIRSGFDGGSWNGPSGITTSLGNASNFGLGYAEASAIFTSFPAMFSGQIVDQTSVLVMFTRFGDANLSGTVNLQDFNRLAANFGTTGAVWSQGDFNYDGNVNLQDFNRLAANFGLSVAGPEVTPQAWARLGAAVPEPASPAVLFGVAASAAILARRRRTSSCPASPRCTSVSNHEFPSMR